MDIAIERKRLERAFRYSHLFEIWFTEIDAIAFLHTIEGKQ